MTTTKNTASNLREIAPAKINLQLKVTARRPDGYHELEVSFLPLWSLHDLVELEFRPHFLQTCCPDYPELAENNLCNKAAWNYSQKAGVPHGWIFHLTKNIPVAAGLGGGSSDAAAVLRLLNNHYKALTDRELLEIAAGLGADVPFFLHPQPSSATGIGEKLLPFDFKLPELPLLLVNPDFPVSAAWAYRNLEPARIGPGEQFHGGTLEEIAAQMQNDLEPAALAKFPLLRIIKKNMLGQGALAACMSGSGPTMFALCRSAAHLEQMHCHFRSAFPACRIFPVIFSA